MDVIRQRDGLLATVNGRIDFENYFRFVWTRLDSIASTLETIGISITYQSDIKLSSMHCVNDLLRINL